MILLRISSNYFVAGIYINNRYVIDTAPILKWMIGKKVDYIFEYCNKKKWNIELLSL